MRELVPRPDDKAQRDLWAHVNTFYTDALNDRAEWENRLAEWDNQYYGVVPEKEFPWAGSSNLHVPVTMVGVETLKPRLTEVVLGATPPVLVVPTEATDEEKQQRVELFLNWQIQNELSVESTVYESAHLFLLPGTVVAKVWWKQDRHRRKFIRMFPSDTPVTDIFTDLFGADVPSFEPAEKLTYEGTIPAGVNGGPPLEVKLKFKLLEDSIQVLVEREELKERPAIELLDPLDFIVPVKAGGDVNTMSICAQRLWLTEQDLRRKVKLGRFYDDAVERLLHESAPTGDASLNDGQEARDVRDNVEGVEGDGATNAKQDQFVILEAYLQWDMDDDGFDEEVIVWVSPDLGDMILGWDYLDNVFAHGRRPFVVGRYHPIPFRFYGLSFPEIVRTLQEEINTIHNQRVDYGTIQNLPMYFYRAASGHTPGAYRLRPGEGVPVDNPQTDIMVPHWQGSPAFGQAEEATLYQYFERLTGLTDLALGRQPTRVGATRTATGVASLLSEAGLRFKTSMAAFQRFWTDVFSHVLALDQQYLPPGKEFRVTGQMPEFIRMKDRTEISGNYDLRLSANTETLNRQIQREDSQAILQGLLNPVALQGNIVGAKGVYKAYRDWLRAFGKSDPDAYLETPHGGIIHTPEEELATLVSGGEMPEPNPMEDVHGHLLAHQLQLRDMTVQAQIGRAGVRALKAHIVKTMQTAKTMMMSQLTGPKPGASGIGPQAQNAEIGRTAPNAAPTAPPTGPAGPPAPPAGMPGPMSGVA